MTDPHESPKAPGMGYRRKIFFFALYALLLFAALFFTHRLRLLGDRLETLDAAYEETLEKVRETADLADDAQDVRIEIVYRETPASE